MVKILVKTYRYISQMKKSINEQEANIILMRHAQSLFNEAEKSEAKRLGIINLPWQQQEKNIQFRKTVCFNKEYMDCTLSQKGVEQCEDAAQSIDKLKVDLVLVSPLNRALQSCDRIVKNKNIPIIVDPLFAQSCRFGCDGIKSGSLKQKMKKFPHFDFSNSKQEKLVYTVPGTTLQLFQQICQKKGLKAEEQKYDQLMLYIEKRIIYQNDIELRQRAWKAKERLLQLSKTYSNILVISHWYILTSILSKKFSQMSQNLKYPNLENCVPYTYGLTQLLKFK